MTVSISLTYEEVDYLIEQLSTNPISGADNIKIVAGLLQYLDDAKNMPPEPPPFDPREIAQVVDALQNNLIDPLKGLWPDYPVMMDALEGGRVDGDNLIFNVFVIIGAATHSIPMSVALDQVDFTEEFKAIKKLIEDEILQLSTHSKGE